MLNENNIMSSFMFNADSGSYNKVRREGIIKLENSRVKINTDSLKIAVDIGYTIDSDIKDITFKINNKAIAIKTLELPEHLASCTLSDNECAIITGNMAFKNIVFLSKELVGKTFYYSILTCNSTLSSFDIDYIASKINKLDTEYLNYSINEIKDSLNQLLIKLEVLDADLYQNENNISIVKEEISNIKNILIENNLSIETRESKSEA